MGMSRRLSRLEASKVRGECSECGLAPGAPFEGYEVTWDDTEEPEPVRPEWCPECGRQTTFVVGWGDLGPADPGEGAS